MRSIGLSEILRWCSPSDPVSYASSKEKMLMNGCLLYISVEWKLTEIDSCTDVSEDKSNQGKHAQKLATVRRPCELVSYPCTDM